MLEANKPGSLTYSDLCATLDSVYQSEYAETARKSSKNRLSGDINNDHLSKTQYEQMIKKHQGITFLEFGSTIQNFLNL